MSKFEESQVSEDDLIEQLRELRASRSTEPLPESFVGALTAVLEQRLDEASSLTRNLKCHQGRIPPELYLILTYVDLNICHLRAYLQRADEPKPATTT